MNREIEFRGYDESCGLWRYGSLLVDGWLTYICQIIQGEIVRWRVTPQSVGQFAGLRDKNGVKIFDGDIVKCENFIYQVVYEGKRFASFALYRKEDMFLHYFGEAMEAKDCEVIGNIYDNPELLDKKEKE